MNMVLFRLPLKTDGVKTSRINFMFIATDEYEVNNDSGVLLFQLSQQFFRCFGWCLRIVFQAWTAVS